MSQNNPPFAIGQKVICVDDRPHRNTGERLLCKTKVYIVADVSQGYATAIEVAGIAGYYFLASRFAPIQSNYSDATAEILEKFKSPNECPDKVIVPEKVKI